MPERLVASDPITLLSVVPELVGFEPRESLVLVTFAGRASLGAFRIDLPPDEDSTRERAIDDPSRLRSDSQEGPNRRAMAAALMDNVRRLPRLDGLVPIVYTDVSCTAGPPSRSLISEMCRAASARGIRVHDSLYVARDGWGSYTGRPQSREELDSATRLRRLDPDIPEIGLAPREAAALPEVDESERRRTAVALAAVDDAEPGVDPVWLAGYSAEWRPDDVGPAATALLASVLAEPSSRDVLLFTWAWGSRAGRRAVRFQERFRRGGPVVDARFAAAFSGADTLGRPDVGSVEHASALLREVAARLPDEARAPALSALAWLSWTLGRSSLAGEYVRQARRADDAYGLAQLLESILTHGVLPEWAFESGAGSRGARSSRVGAGLRSS